MQPQFSSHEENPSSPGRISSSSASSSASSFDPFQDVDDDENDILDTSTHPFQDVDDDENDILDTSTPKYVQDSPSSPSSVVKSAAEWSMISASPIPGPLSPNQSPPIQTMDRVSPDHYDPYRIPSSVFASKPASPMEWSIVSNDSLFSLHMRDNSFKSGELSAVMEVAGENHERSDSMWEDSPGEKMEDEKTKVMEKTDDLRKDSVTRTERVGFSLRSAKLPDDGGERPPIAVARTCASTPRHSHESGTSSRSFAFPVLIADGGRSGSSVKLVDVLQSKPPETPQPQAPVVSPKPVGTTWFSCFSCCPRCC